MTANLLEVNLPLCRSVTEHFYLALVIFREARGERLDARSGVGWTVLNRVARPGWWGASVDEVCTKKWQYSSLTDPNDPQVARVWPIVRDPVWQQCFEIARRILAGEIPNPVPGSDSYFDQSITPPYWTEGARFCAKLGRLSFWDVDRDYERETIDT